MKTKYVLEFGVRGGQHVGNLIIPSHKLATQLAANMVRVFDGEQFGIAAQTEHWALDSSTRVTWFSPTHYVALSKLPNAMGAASAGLWRKSELGEREFGLRLL